MRHNLVLLLLLAGLLLWIGTGQVAATVNQAAATTWTAAGGGYQLTVVTWDTPVVAQGGGYTLFGPDTPVLTGNGCCCLFMPCVKDEP